MKFEKNNTLFNIRVNKDLKQAVEEALKRKQMSMSEFIREKFEEVINHETNQK